jgi:WD40 repeat protein
VSKKTFFKNCALLVGVILLGTVIYNAQMPVQAQEQPPAGAPIARLEAGDFRALAVTADGQYLMVADAANDQIRVYDLSQRGQQPLVAAVSVDGTPVDMTAAGDFAIVLVDTGTNSDLVQVIAPADYDPAQAFAPTTWIDIPNNPRSVAISPNNRWAVAVSEDGFTLLELLSADNVNSAINDGSFNDAVLTNDRLFLAPVDEAMIIPAALDSGAQAALTRPLELDAPAVRLAINLNGTLGAAALENGGLTLFNLRTLTSVNVGEIGEVSDIQFLSHENGEWLVVLNADGEQVTVYDVTDPENVGEMGSLALENVPVRAIAIFDTLILVADSDTVNIYPTSDEDTIFSD